MEPLIITIKPYSASANSIPAVIITISGSEFQDGHYVTDTERANIKITGCVDNYLQDVKAKFNDDDEDFADEFFGEEDENDSVIGV